MDPFALKFYSLIQIDFDGNFGLRYRTNLVTCEQDLTVDVAGLAAVHGPAQGDDDTAGAD